MKDYTLITGITEDERITSKIPSESDINNEINMIFDMNEEALEKYLTDNGVDLKTDIPKVKGIFNGQLSLLTKKDFTSKERFNKFLKEIINLIIDIYVKGDTKKGGRHGNSNEDDEVKPHNKIDNEKKKSLINTYTNRSLRILNLFLETVNCNPYHAFSYSFLLVMVFGLLLLPKSVDIVKYEYIAKLTGDMIDLESKIDVESKNEINKSPYIKKEAISNSSTKEEEILINEITIAENKLPEEVIGGTESHIADKTPLIPSTGNKNKKRDFHGKLDVLTKTSNEVTEENGFIEKDKTFYHYISRFNYSSDLMEKINNIKYKTGDSYKITIAGGDIKRVEIGNNGIYYYLSKEGDGSTKYNVEKIKTLKTKTISINGFISHEGDDSLYKSLLESKKLDEKIITQITSLASKSINDIDFTKLKIGDYYTIVVNVNFYNDNQLNLEEIIDFSIERNNHKEDISKKFILV